MMGRGRLVSYTKLSNKMTVLLPKGQFVRILNLHPFSEMYPIITKALVKGLAARTVLLMQMTALTARAVDSYTSPITARKPTLLSLVILAEIPTAANSQDPASEGHSDQMYGLPSGFELPLRHLEVKETSLLFALTSSLYHLMSVCNFFLGYSKVYYHVACLTLSLQHAKAEMFGQPVTGPIRMRANKLGMTVMRPFGAPGRACHGPLERWTFC